LKKQINQIKIKLFATIRTPVASLIFLQTNTQVMSK